MSSVANAYINAAAGICGGVAGLSVLHWLLTKTDRMIDAVAEFSASAEDMDELITMARDSLVVRDKVLKAEQHYRTLDNHRAADQLRIVLQRSIRDGPSTQQNPSQTHPVPNLSSQSSSRTYSEGTRRIQQPCPNADRRRRGQHSDQDLPLPSAAFDIESQQLSLASERRVGNQGDNFPDGSRRPPPGLCHSTDVSSSLSREPMSSRARQRSWGFSRRVPGRVRRESGPRQATSGQRGDQLETDQVAPSLAQQQSETRGTTRDRPSQPLGSRQTAQDPRLPPVGSRDPTQGRDRRQIEQPQPQNQPRPSPLPSHQPEAENRRGGSQAE